MNRIKQWEFSEKEESFVCNENEIVRCSHRCGSMIYFFYFISDKLKICVCVCEVLLNFTSFRPRSMYVPQTPTAGQI